MKRIERSKDADAIQPLNPEKLLQMAENKKQSISETHVYYNLRRYHVRHFQKETVETVRYCLALDSLGLPITVHLLKQLMPNRSTTAILHMLHALGDKRVLIMRKPTHPTRKHVWRVNPAFKELFSLVNDKSWKEKVNTNWV